MSRIHEALKKAEQERAANSQPLPIEPVEAAGDVHHSAQTEEARSAYEPVAPPEPDRSTRPISEPGIPGILTQCARQEWKADPRNLLFLNGNSNAPGTEEFRKLRSSLYQIRTREEVRTILVTSAMPAEGKSFVTANLSMAFARQHERRVLAIDADLRLSSLHKSYGAPASPGLSEYLRGECNEFGIIQRGASENMFFIPAGASVSNPLELIGNGKLQFLLRKIAPLFDWVLLDSPPVLPVSDSTVLAGVCDGALFVVRAKATNYELVLKAKKELGDTRLLGVVLNGVEPREAYSYYYYSRYYTAPGSLKATPSER